MILKVHLDGAASHDVGNEIWQELLVDAIHAEAETIASHAGSDLLRSSDQAERNALRDRIVGEMTAALVSVGERYRAPDGVRYSLIEQSPSDLPSGEGMLRAMGNRSSEPIVEEVLRFEDLPPGSAGTRRAVVRWSDGTEGAPMTWYGGRAPIPSRSRRLAVKGAERGAFRVMSMFTTSHPDALDVRLAAFSAVREGMFLLLGPGWLDIE